MSDGKVGRYRKRPVMVQAIQWTGENLADVLDFCPAAAWGNATGLAIATTEGVMRADRDDWVIRGVAGEFYPCKPEVFEATYESQDNPQFPFVEHWYACSACGSRDMILVGAGVTVQPGAELLCTGCDFNRHLRSMENDFRSRQRVVD